MGGVLIYNKLDTPVETRRRKDIMLQNDYVLLLDELRLKLLDVKPQPIRLRCKVDLRIRKSQPWKHHSMQAV